MPGIVAGYNVNDRVANELGSKERQQRMELIQTYWKYYDGDHKRWLNPNPEGRDDNVIINLAGRSVDKMQEFVGSPQRIQIAQEDGASDSPAQQRIDDWWTDYQTDMTEIVQSGLVTGHTFYKLYLDTDDEPAFVMLDPCYIIAFWDILNPKRTLFYRLEWVQGDNRYRQDIVPDWLLETPKPGFMPIAPVPVTWSIIDYRAWGQGWRELNKQDWEYPFAPIVDYPIKKRAHNYYGMSMLSGGRAGLNDGVNFTTSNIGRILYHHAHPKTFVFGAELDEKGAVGGFWDDLDPEARVETLEMQSDLASSMNFAGMLKGEFFSGVRVLDTSNIKDKMGQITNFGVRMLFDDQIEAWEDITQQVGGGLSEVFYRMLIVAGETVEEKPKVIWKDPLPTNRLEKLQEAQIEEGLNTTSNKTIAEDIGRNYEAEAQQRAEEELNAGRALTNILNFGATRGALA